MEPSKGFYCFNCCRGSTDDKRHCDHCEPALDAREASKGKSDGMNGGKDAAKLLHCPPAENPNLKFATWGQMVANNNKIADAEDAATEEGDAAEEGGADKCAPDGALAVCQEKFKQMEKGKSDGMNGGEDGKDGGKDGGEDGTMEQNDSQDSQAPFPSGWAAALAAADVLDGHRNSRSARSRSPRMGTEAPDTSTQSDD